jgi:ABC-type nickel/cobalt efflux system permease component RcnA
MRKLVVLLTALAALVAPAIAAAHPLGNFTINRYSRIEPSGDRIYVLYVLDMAEIPTFQEQPTVRSEGEDAYARTTAAAIMRNLELRVDGRPIQLRPLRQALAFPPGVAGLRTTRLEIVFATPPLGAGKRLRLTYHDGNYAGRIGWKEIVVRAGTDAAISGASVPSKTISEELLAYPKNLLQSPLDVTEARARLELGSGPGAAPTLPDPKVLEQRVAVRAISDSGFASLIARDNLSASFILVALAIAFFWGAAHSFSPGHGKAVVAAYLVGSRGTPRHAVLLGLTVTVTHTIGVFALGLVTLSLSAFIVPEQLYPWLNLVSALLIVGVGVGVLRWRLREWRQGTAGNAHHDHDHDHGHGHDHAPSHGCGCRSHSHAGDPGMTRRQLLGIGISGGIIPCPTALVVLLAAIALHRVAFGLALILAFSIGLAAAMIAIGLVAVTAKRTFSRVDFNGGLIRLLPAVSALVVLGLGLVMTWRALPKVT